MTLSMIIMSKQPSPMLDIPSTSSRHKLNLLTPREKVIIVMGATGTGKSRLSIDLATQFPAEIVNSDKMQVYNGLDIITNKIAEDERSGVPHHLMGVVNPNLDFTAKNFCDMASVTVEAISSRGRLPMIVGGSNSFVEALVDGKVNDVRFRSRYECCFLWIDVSMHVLHRFVSKRVDQMIENGMVDEAREYFDPSMDYDKGIRRSIGVPELDAYFRNEHFLDKRNRDRLLDDAIQEIKNNTCMLACRQVEKISRLRNVKGWNIHRLDATQVFNYRGRKADDAWRRLITRPSTAIAREFLYNISDEVPMTSLAVRDRNIPCLMA